MFDVCCASVVSPRTFSRRGDRLSHRALQTQMSNRCSSSLALCVFTRRHFVQGFLEKISPANDFHFQKSVLIAKTDLDFSVTRRGQNLPSDQLTRAETFDEVGELMFVRQFQRAGPQSEASERLREIRFENVVCRYFMSCGIE